MRPILGLALVGIPAAAGAVCPVDTFLSCTTNNGADVLQFCVADRSISYRYGPKGAPELTLDRDVSDVEIDEWVGAGPSFWEGVQMTEGDYVYNVFFSQERFVDGEPGPVAPIGGVRDYSGEDQLANTPCDPGTVEVGVLISTID